MAKERETTIIINADDETKAALESARKNFTEFERSTLNIVDRMQNSWTTLNKTVGIASGVYLAQKAYDVLRRTFEAFGQAFEQHEKRISFDNLARSVSSNSTQIINDLRKASHDTITFQQSIETAGRAILLGLEPKTISRLMEIARASSKVTGQTIQNAFDDITLGVARQSKMILDNLGILLDYDKHLDNLSNTLGKTKEQLTDLERRQAFLNATFEAGQEIIARVGESTVSLNEKFSQFKTIVSDTADDLKNYLLGIKLIEQAVGASKYPNYVQEYGELQKKLDELIPRYNELKNAIDEVNKGVRDPSRFLAENFQKAKMEVAELQARMNEISNQLGIGDTIEIIKKKSKDTTSAILQDWKQWEKDYAELVDRAGQSAINTLNNIEKEERERVEKDRKLVLETAKFRQEVYADMYESLGFDTAKYYEYRKSLLEKQREEEIKVTGDIQLAWEAYHARLRELEEQRLERSGEFADGIKLYYSELERDGFTWAKGSRDMMRDFQSGAENTLSNFFGNIIKRQKSFKDAFGDLMTGMADTFIDAVNQMIVKWLIFKMLTSFGGGGNLPTTGELAAQEGMGLAGTVPQGGVSFHAGGWVTGNKAPRRFHLGGLASDEVPAILQKGEYVLSKGQAASLKREGSSNQGEGITVVNQWNIQTVDAASFGQFAMKNSSIFAAAIMKEQKNNNPIRRR